jgi:PAS domain S-box-containing protein
MLIFILGLLAACGIGLSAFLLLNEFKTKIAIEKREKDSARRIYELAILRELGDRIGYSLDVNQIVDIITSSLHQFIEYAAVSYMLIEPEKVMFKMHLERSVHRRFVTDVRDRMLSSLGALLDHEFKKEDVKEILSGAILLEEVDEPVRSFFNIPLVIGDKVVGVLTVSDTKGGLYKEEEMTILYKLIQQASKAVTSLQAVVKSEQEKVAAMVESMEDGVVMTDANYRILVINPAAKRVIGKEQQKEITIFDFIDNLGGKMDMRGRLEEAVKLRKSHVSERFEINSKFYQGFVFPVKSESTLTSDDIFGGVVIFHDVTREVELERVREDFTSMIVHELRTPLSGIQKTSELLKLPQKRGGAVQTKKFVDLIYQNSSGMLDLVNDILDASKLQAGKFEVQLEPTDFSDILENRKQFFEISANDRHIKLDAVISKDLPKNIPLDHQRMKQVLNNLMSNALKYTPDNGTVTVSAFVHDPAESIASEIGKLKVTFPAPLANMALPSDKHSLVVAVSDTGVGIAEDLLPRLFSKYQQLNNASFMSHIKGTGLGLAIAKGIVEAHGGSIGVASQVGAGSVFYFVIPFSDSLLANPKT